MARVARIVVLLGLAGLAGLVLGACGGGGGGGNAAATRTGVTATVPTVTGTRPEVTRPSRTTPTEPATTAVTPTEPTTTEPSPIVPSTTSTEATTTIEPTTTAVAAPPPTSSESSTPWGWIALALGLGAAGVIGIIVWTRRRSGAASWASQSDNFNRQSLVAMDAVLSQGSVVTGQVQALAAEARSLEAHAPDDQSRAEAARRRARLDELAQTLEADRTLRMSSPPPSADQLSYSEALIRQQVEQLQGVLRPAAPSGPS